MSNTARHIRTALTLGATFFALAPAIVLAAPVKPVPPAVTAALRGEIKMEDRASAFANNNINRNPFWPVAWKPGMAKVTEKPQEKLNPQEVFSISSIMLGPPDLAVINGKRYEVGESIPLIFGTQKLSFKVVQILDGAVVMSYGPQKFTVNKRGRNPDRAK